MNLADGTVPSGLIFFVVVLVPNDGVLVATEVAVRLYISRSGKMAAWGEACEGQLRLGLGDICLLVGLSSGDFFIL